MKSLRTIIIMMLAPAMACVATKPAAVGNTANSSEAITPVVSTTVVAAASLAGPDTTKWAAPEDAAAVKNPIESSEDVLEEGMIVYKKNCRSCHGKHGDGQGAGAEDCKVPPSDFTQPRIAALSDGDLFWKIRTGRNDMDSYKDELDEEETWQVILYIRSIAESEE